MLTNRHELPVINHKLFKDKKFQLFNIFYPNPHNKSHIAPAEQNTDDYS